MRVDRIQDRGAGQGGASDLASRHGAESACRRSARDRLSLDGEPDVRGTGWKQARFDQVVVALGPGASSLSIDGKPAKTSWARGDVQFIGRGVAHEAKNTGGKPVDMMIVAIK